MNSSRPTLFLTEKVPWFGSKTGYECLPLQLNSIGFETQEITTAPSFFNRLVGKAVNLSLRSGSSNSIHSSAQFFASLRLMANRRQVLHILYGDHHAPLWGRYPKHFQSRSLLTLHQPRSQWTQEALAHLKNLKNVLLLYQRDLPFFSDHLPDARIDFILHGADTDFFRPPSQKNNRHLRVLYNGVHLRNVKMLTRLLNDLHARFPQVMFDFLVPEHRRNPADFGLLLNHPAITWHAGLDNNQLLTLYQSSDLLWLPMDDSGANTAIVEALACGLPIVTTDVGGIRDYGGGTLYPVVDNNDDAAMFAELEALLTNDDLRAERSQANRQFAESHLAWPSIAKKHHLLYQTLQK